jgi:thymidylate synthase (FAD)
MANAVIEINTTRDIARQILRHRSFSFQEFSQRYADPSVLGTEFVQAEARLQDHKNRQNSIEVEDNSLQNWFDYQTWNVQQTAWNTYKEAIDRGIAKEVARKVLPEGLTQSRMYVNGTIRSWLHYCQVRMDPSTQKEHREVAQAIYNLLKEELPNVFTE